MLFDNAPPALPLPEDKRLTVVTGDIADRETVARLIAPGTDAVFHLAAIVSGQAEADTDLGYRVNLDGTRAVLDACRALGPRRSVVFASSLAVYGGALPPEVGDETALTPQTSYGAQKAIGELLVNDYSRKGFVDGRALRLPTVVVRPGRPNRAASTFASSMIREPLAGPRRGVSGVARHGDGAGVAAPHRRRAGARARSAGRRVRREPVVAAAGLLGVGRRDGRGVAPRRRRGGLSRAFAGSPTRRSRRSSRAGRERWRRRAPRRSASAATAASTR